MKVGDLVVVKNMCCQEQYIGMFATIAELFTGRNACPVCKTEHVGVAAAFLADIPGNVGFRLSWLQLIPPIADLDKAIEEEEMYKFSHV